MNEKFFIERHGKRFVLFAGLLDEAHSRGLQSIKTQLIQVPTEANGNVAIVNARARLLDEDGTKIFTGIGDASPENVGKNIAPHIIRMAETRAKARALRDAVNIGVTAFEEIGEEGEPQAQDKRQSQPIKYHSATATGPIVGQQVNADLLQSLIRNVWGEDGLQKFVNKNGPIEELSRGEMLNWIDYTKAALRKREERELKAT